MSKQLVIVESPTKARTISRYLGKDFTALASYGHVRDLEPKTGAVDPEHDFAMRYVLVEKNKKHVDAIIREAKKADTIYLATDPDREGEAISWHIRELLKDRNILKGKEIYRVAFHEFTKRAIQQAMEDPHELSISLIDAQQARRALDYLVGFNLSPLLWKKVRAGLSAGRVQSPALRMIVEREEEIERFKTREYWTMETDLNAGSDQFSARLSHYAGEKLTQFSITDAAQATSMEEELLRAAAGKLHVDSVEAKQRKRNPAPPFTTSTMQQEAARKLGFTAQRTMRVAQQLYEGISIDGESVGLITYMRTDAVNLAQEAVTEIRDWIVQTYGSDNVPASPNVYKTKSKNAQEAHEAVRPTAAARVPAKIRSGLNEDQYKLYELIWKRAVASQMIHATLNTVTVVLRAGENHLFRATGSTVANPGFMVLYREGRDDSKEEADQKFLPVLKKGQIVDLLALRKEQHFTEPPPRYSEASLVKTLEAYGIGRPSTYASIISTLQFRNYVELDRKRFMPTDIGRIVNRFLTEHFERYVDYNFTARMEDALDAVSRGEKAWKPIMARFWKDFSALVESKEESVKRSDVLQAREIGVDPESGRPITVRMGRYGPFVQIGTRDDEEKPRFAGLRPGQKMDQIDLEMALALFALPRDMGETAEGEEMQVNIGRFGPYVRFGSLFVSLKKDDDPYTISRERALELVTEKKEKEANRIIHDFTEQDIQVLRGRYGPYITDGENNARIPKGTEGESVTLEQAQQWLQEFGKPVRKKATKKAVKKTTAKKKPVKRTTKMASPGRKKSPTKRKSATSMVKKKSVVKRASVKKASTQAAAQGPN